MEIAGIFMEIGEISVFIVCFQGNWRIFMESTEFSWKLEKFQFLLCALMEIGGFFMEIGEFLWKFVEF